MSHLQDRHHTDAADTSREALRRLNRVLSRDPEREIVDVMVEDSDEAIRLPREVARLLQEILVNTVAGRSVSVIPKRAELTTQQAADLLNVSRPHVIKLIDEGLLPGHKTGTHRRVYAADVREYKHQRDLDARSAADELTALTEEMGLYE